MKSDSFPRRDVDRAFRRFNDIVNDLSNAQFQTWGNYFSHMITHCETNPVMQVMTGPLKINKNVDARKWFDDALKSVGGMVGSGHYDLPYDDEDRTALLYQFFLMIENNEVDFLSFCLNMYGKPRYQDSVETFNRELVEKFTREVAYKLNEIMDDIGEENQVSSEAMMVFHHHDNSMNIHGNIQGSNIAVGASVITDSNASYTNQEQLSDALKSLKPLMHEVSEGQRKAVESSLELLIRASHDRSISADQVADATKEISAASPKLGGKLKEIAEKIGISLASSTIFLGFKAALGLKP